MRKYLAVVFAIALTTAVSANTITYELVPAKAKASTVFQYSSSTDAMDAQLSQGVYNEVSDLKVGYALDLANENTEENVTKLITLLNNDDNENVRIAAAFSLLKIGNYRGVDAVVNTANTDNNSRVRNVCATLFYQKVKVESAS